MAVIAFVVGLLPLALIAAASLHRGISPGLLTRDPTSIGGIHPLSGALSSLGILLWWTSGVVWMSSAYLLRSARIASSYRFAVWSGLLSAYLALDDLFQFHDIIGPEYMGISENAVYLILMIIIAAYIAAFWRQILRPDGVLLVLSFGWLAVSAAMDTILEPMLIQLGRWLVFLEDAAKWLGITCWLAFCLVRCRAEINGARSFSRQGNTTSGSGVPVTARAIPSGKGRRRARVALPAREYRRRTHCCSR